MKTPSLILNHILSLGSMKKSVSKKTPKKGDKK